MTGRSTCVAVFLLLVLAVPASLAVADPIRVGNQQTTGAYSMGIHATPDISALLTFLDAMLVASPAAGPLMDLPATAPPGGGNPGPGNPPGGGVPPGSPDPPAEGEPPVDPSLPPGEEGVLPGDDFFGDGDGIGGGAGGAGSLDFDAAFSDVASPAAVPEPGTLLLVGAGLAGAACARRRRRPRGRGYRDAAPIA